MLGESTVQDRQCVASLLGPRLKRVREQKFGRRKAYIVAQLAGIRERDYYAYESGRYCPTLPVLLRICRVLECTTDELLGDLLMAS